ncbi:antibiotic biosynthesis monooxygenase family protein, partial [Burkholderia ubonensis]|uniref:antibiotic biosynthesis monooxygenase family protein n=1 Tax=Burkholderia ubonensis TaxID=101571 RepID=UPI000AC3E772
RPSSLKIASRVRRIVGDGFIDQCFPNAGLIQNVYYWESEEALQQLIAHPAHLEAKAKQARWLDGYRVVISKVLREYGDGRLVPPLGGGQAG